MKRKICKYLDSNLWGMMQIMPKAIHPCCMTSKTFYKDENLDFSQISIEEYMQKRKDYAEQINQGVVCKGCELIVERDENEIDVGKVSYINLSRFTTCNLRCKYCYYTKEQLSEKLNSEKTHILPFIKKLVEHDVLKDNIRIGLFGGEPLLFDDVAESLQYIAKRYKNPSLSFISNSTITTRAIKLAQDLNSIKHFKKDLYTSVDAGTAKSYKEIRGKDLYKALKKNLIYYAKNNVFNMITLKYILLFDHTNTSDKDIFGFLLLFNKVMRHQKGRMVFAMDYDILCKEPVSIDMIMAAGKLFYVASKIFQVDVSYEGTGMIPDLKKGRDCIKLLEEYADFYEKAPKNLFELTILSYLRISSFFAQMLKKYNKFIILLKIIYFQ
jgi:organic radical activating enzyme